MRSILCSCSTPRDRPGKTEGNNSTRAQDICSTPRPAYAGHSTSNATDVFWCTARRGLGHRTYLRCLRTPGGRRKPSSCTRERRPSPTAGASGRSAKRTGVHHSLHGADRDPRALMKLGDAIPAKYDLRQATPVWVPWVSPSIRKAWMWYHKIIGAERCPIVDTWWQTETGGRHDDAHSGPSRRPNPVPVPNRCPGFLSTSSMTRAGRWKRPMPAATW